jgi:hypothetical protein
MTPTEELKHEHQIILMVLDAAKREVDAIARVEAVETGEGLHERYHKLAHELAKG